MHPRIGHHHDAFVPESTARFIMFCRDNGFRHMTLVTPILTKDEDAQAVGEAQLFDADDVQYVLSLCWERHSSAGLT